MRGKLGERRKGIIHALLATYTYTHVQEGSHLHRDTGTQVDAEPQT